MGAIESELKKKENMKAGSAAKLIVDALLQRFLPLARRRIETAQAQVQFLLYVCPCIYLVMFLLKSHGWTPICTIWLMGSFLLLFMECQMMCRTMFVLDHKVCGDWKWEYEVLTFVCCYRVERRVESCKDLCLLKCNTFVVELKFMLV